MPRKCPVCGAPAVREKKEAIRRCIGIECPARNFRNIVHFASKAGMDIEGLGYAIIEQMVDKGMLKRYCRYLLLEKRRHCKLKEKWR